MDHHDTKAQSTTRAPRGKAGRFQVCRVCCGFLGRGGKRRHFLPALAALAGAALMTVAPARGQSSASPLKLLISINQPYVTQPDAARILLHLHNSGQQTVWLYRRARGKHPPEQHVSEEGQPVPSTGGSTVEIQIQPADARAASTPAQATVLEYAQMPKPRLVKLPAGGDYEETSIVQLRPALTEGQMPLFGAYRLSVVYGASYSNGDEFQRNLGVTLWQGEVASNTIPIELRPPLPDSVGVLSGETVGADLKPRAGIRVSLSDEQGQLIDQRVTEAEGKFTFDHLPLSLYWITGRREGAAEDTVTFRHEELGSTANTASAQLVFYSPEIYEAKKLVHKPCLLRVFDPGGKPLGGVEIDATYSNGQVVDDVKVTSSDDGTATLELLPGRSSVSLKQRGCAEQVDRADVTPGAGVENFKFVFDCAKK